MGAPEHVVRDYAAFLRGPVGTNTFAFGTIAAYRDGVWHMPQLSVFPEPQDATAEDFGLQGSGGFTVEIVDESDDDDWPIHDENYEPLLDEAGSVVTMEY